MANTKQIVYLTQTQYAELLANGTITVNGVTVTYNENDIYVTPQAEPVTDVKVNGVSVSADGVANIPLASSSAFGVAKINTNYGVGIYNGQLQTQLASVSSTKAGTHYYHPITPYNQHQATFYGLAKAAGHDEKNSTEPLGTYTPEAKGAIQSMLGTNTMIAPDENDLVADRDYAVGDLFTANGKVYKVTAEILTGSAIVTAGNNVNCEETSVSDAFMKDVQVNGSSIVQNGVANVLLNNLYGVYLDNNYLKVHLAGPSYIKGGMTYGEPIGPNNQHYSAFYGLAKAAGHDEKNSALQLGQYTPEAQSAIRSMIGAANADDIVAVQDTQPTSEDNKIWLPETTPEGVEIPTVAEMNAALAEKVGDVQVNGVSIVQNGVANVPVASQNTLGVVKMFPSGGENAGLVLDSEGRINTQGPTDNNIKLASSRNRPITPYTQHKSTFYGLAKAAGDTTQSQSDNPVGQYTDSAKAAIKSMLGIEGSSSGEVVTPIDDTAGVGDTAKVWSADKTSTEINNIIDTAPTEELAADLLMQEETNTYLNEKFLSSIHNMFESLPQDEILSEILNGLVDGNSLLRQLYHELEARKLAAE